MEKCGDGWQVGEEECDDGIAGNSVPGKVGTKYKIASFDRIRAAVVFLERRNALQPVVEL